ncbi:transposase [Nocardia amamiensis]|uniref:Transposase n=1 Tax=Nocardia amamiensis TaxID=404578 RepID=A0ABS0D5I9_9NOCA|nr:transposase [Nocardia amamiensis]MBF6302444.1 transposase [Nocardia amamiensis]
MTGRRAPASTVGRYARIDAAVRDAAITAVQALEARGQSESTARRVVAEQLGVSASAIRDWIRVAEGRPRKLVSVSQLRRELADARAQLDVVTQLNRDLVAELHARRHNQVRP